MQNNYNKNSDISGEISILFSDMVSPEGGDLPQTLMEACVKRKNRIWTVHKSDADPWSSRPHAHSENLVLNLYTGEVLNKKDLSEIIKLFKEKGVILSTTSTTSNT